MTDEDYLIERLRFRLLGPEPPTDRAIYPGRPPRTQANPPAREEVCAEAERQLGFALPPLLRRLYCEVGDGGFGPSFGILPLQRTSASPASDWPGSLVTVYLENRSATQADIDEWFADDEVKPPLWPEKLMVICDWGCNIYSCVDCSQPRCPVLRNDNNAGAWMFARESPSLARWLNDWLDGKRLFFLDWEAAPKVRFDSRSSAV